MSAPSSFLFHEREIMTQSERLRLVIRSYENSPFFPHDGYTIKRHGRLQRAFSRDNKGTKKKKEETQAWVGRGESGKFTSRRRSYCMQVDINFLPASLSGFANIVQSTVPPAKEILIRKRRKCEKRRFHDNRRRPTFADSYRVSADPICSSKIIRGLMMYLEGSTTSATSSFRARACVFDNSRG